MSFLSKLVSAPLRILDIPNRIMIRAVGDDPNTEDTLLENVAKDLEKQVKKITGNHK